MRFDATWDELKSGKKTQTCRRVAFYDWYKHRIGQIIHAEPPNKEEQPIKLKLTSVFTCKLEEVASNPEHYTREGYQTGQEFVNIWKKLYGVDAWKPESEVCVLRFDVVKPE